MKEHLVKIENEKIEEIAKRYDSIGVMDALIRTYQRYYYNMEETRNLFMEVSYESIGCVDVDFLFKIHTRYMLNRIILSVKFELDALLEDKVAFGYTNILFSNKEEDGYIFKVLP